jgi:hypothetical protein
VRRWAAVIGVAAIVLITVAAFLWVRAELSRTPTCEERGGTPVTYRWSDNACLIPGGIIVPGDDD